MKRTCKWLSLYESKALATHVQKALIKTKSLCKYSWLQMAQIRLFPMSCWLEVFSRYRYCIAIYLHKFASFGSNLTASKYIFQHLWSGCHGVKLTGCWWSVCGSSKQSWQSALVLFLKGQRTIELKQEQKQANVTLVFF